MTSLLPLEFSPRAAVSDGFDGTVQTTVLENSSEAIT
jgi:hypothetical protein